MIPIAHLECSILPIYSVTARITSHFERTFLLHIRAPYKDHLVCVHGLVAKGAWLLEREDHRTKNTNPVLPSVINQNFQKSTGKKVPMQEASHWVERMLAPIE